MNSDNLKRGRLGLYRSFFDHPFWTEQREFSKAEAWLDLLQTARYESSDKKEYVGGKLLMYSRGQLPASIRFLKDRWGWGSNKKVESFLEKLEKGDMIVIDRRQGQNVITICNYDTYNPSKKDKETPTQEKGDTEETGRRRGGDKSNKENKEKEYNSLEVLQQRFAQLEAANAALVSEVEALKEEKGATEPAEQPVAPASLPPVAEAKPAKAKKPAPEPFVPPTEAEVKAEFVARTSVNGAISEKFAQVFTSHYALKDWKYGKAKVPLKDWKRAMSSAWDLPRFISENQHLAPRSPNVAGPQVVARKAETNINPNACI